jgi:hypothetical protein
MTDDGLKSYDEAFQEYFIESAKKHDQPCLHQLHNVALKRIEMFLRNMTIVKDRL